MDEIFSKYWLTIFLSAIIISWFIYVLPKFKSYIKENPFGDYEEPRFFATLGVLGTFVGIAWGLFNFNPAPGEMQQSVMELLEGMRTAFVTSILGMLFSLILTIT